MKNAEIYVKLILHMYKDELDNSATEIFIQLVNHNEDKYSNNDLQKKYLHKYYLKNFVF